MNQWDAETVRRIVWFKDAVMPPAPFQFRSGVQITDSAKFRNYLEADIAMGPNGPRARLGAIQHDLEQLENIIVHGLKPQALRPVYGKEAT